MSSFSFVNRPYVWQAATATPVAPAPLPVVHLRNDALKVAPQTFTAQWSLHSNQNPIAQQHLISTGHPFEQGHKHSQSATLIPHLSVGVELPSNQNALRAAKDLTKQIVGCATVEQLYLLYHLHHASFNAIHVSTALYQLAKLHMQRPIAAAPIEALELYSGVLPIPDTSASRAAYQCIAAQNASGQHSKSELNQLPTTLVEEDNERQQVTATYPAERVKALQRLLSAPTTERHKEVQKFRAYAEKQQDAHAFAGLGSTSGQVGKASIPVSNCDVLSATGTSLHSLEPEATQLDTGPPSVPEGIHSSLANKSTNPSTSPYHVAHLGQVSAEDTVQQLPSRSTASRAAWLRQALVAQVFQLKEQLDCQAMCNICYALARLNHSDAALFQWVMLASEPRLATGFTNQNLCNLIWAFAKLSFLPSKQWLQTFYATAFKKMGRQDHHSISVCLWALAKLHVKPPPVWVDHMLQNALACPSPQPDHLAKIMHALGRIKYRPGRDCLLQLVQACEAQLVHAKSEELAMMLWGFVRIKHPLPHQFVSACCHAIRQSLHQFGPRELSMTLYALAQLNRRPSKRVLRELLAISQENMQSWPLQPCVTVLWSLSKLSVLKPHTHRSKQNWLTGVGLAALQKLPQANPRDVAMLMTGLGKARHRLGRLWVTRLCRCTEQKLQQYNPQELVMVLYGLRQCFGLPTASWLGHFITAVCMKWELFNQPELRRIRQVVRRLPSRYRNPVVKKFAMVLDAALVTSQGRSFQEKSLPEAVAVPARPAGRAGTARAGDHGRLSRIKGSGRRIRIYPVRPVLGTTAHVFFSRAHVGRELQYTLNTK